MRQEKIIKIFNNEIYETLKTQANNFMDRCCAMRSKQVTPDYKYTKEDENEIQNLRSTLAALLNELGVAASLLKFMIVADGTILVELKKLGYEIQMRKELSHRICFILATLRLGLNQLPELCPEAQPTSQETLKVASMIYRNRLALLLVEGQLLLPAKKTASDEAAAYLQTCIDNYPYLEKEINLEDPQSMNGMGFVTADPALAKVTTFHRASKYYNEQNYQAVIKLITTDLKDLKENSGSVHHSKLLLLRGWASRRLAETISNPKARSSHSSEAINDWHHAYQTTKCQQFNKAFSPLLSIIAFCVLANFFTRNHQPGNPLEKAITYCEDGIAYSDGGFITIELQWIYFLIRGLEINTAEKHWPELPEQFFELEHNPQHLKFYQDVQICIQAVAKSHPQSVDNFVCGIINQHGFCGRNELLDLPQARIYHQIAISYLSLEKPEEAIQYLFKALQTEPNPLQRTQFQQEYLSHISEDLVAPHLERINLHLHNKTVVAQADKKPVRRKLSWNENGNPGAFSAPRGNASKKDNSQSNNSSDVKDDAGNKSESSKKQQNGF